MAVTTKEEAFEYWCALLARAVMAASAHIKVQDLIEQERLNLCYYASYYNPEQRDRILNLFFKKE